MNAGFTYNYDKVWKSSNDKDLVCGIKNSASSLSGNWDVFEKLVTSNNLIISPNKMLVDERLFSLLLH